MVVKHTMNQRGASLVEYSLLVSLVAILAIGGVRAYGAYVTKPFCRITGAIVSGGNANFYDWTVDQGPGGRPDCVDTTGWGDSVWYTP